MRVKISSELTDRLVHKWRAEEAAVLVGTNTLLNDDPSLTVRNWQGRNPVRVVVDNELKANLSSNIFDGNAKTILINQEKEAEEGDVVFFKQLSDETFITAFIRCLNNSRLSSVIIEGGAKILQLFFDEGLWDEARVITNTSLYIGEGIKSPVMKDNIFLRSENISSDRLDLYKRNGNEFL